MRIRELDLAVRVTGSGMPFIWAHGMMSCMASEDAVGILQWQTFPDGLRLVRYDARGHGANAAPACPQDQTWPNLGRDMLALADAFDGERFVAAGWSMGCATALHAAIAAPARAEALVLMLPPTVWEARVAQAALYRRALRLGQAMGVQRLAGLGGGTLPDWLLQAAPHMGQAARQGMRQLSLPAMSALFEGAALSDLPPRASLEVLARTPALIIGWAGDPTHPLESARELHRLLPRSTLFIATSYDDVLTIPARLSQFVQTL